MPCPFRIHEARITLLLCGIYTLSLLSPACNLLGSKTKVTDTQTTSKTASGTDASPIQITTASAIAREMPSFIEATGSLTAKETSDVAPQTSGQIVATPVNVGAFVRLGEVIARLNERDARLHLQETRAAEQQAAATVRQAEVRLGLNPGGRFDASAIPEVRAAGAAFDSALAQARLADVNARRYAELVETGDVARSVYDQYRTQSETARAQANDLHQQLESAINVARQSNQVIKTAEAALAGARAQTAVAEKALADTTVRAPYAGYVSSRPIAVGEYVTPASVILTVLRTNPIKLQLQLPELEAPNVRPGMSVSLSVEAYPKRQFSGRVVAVNPAIDPVSRSMTVEADIENPDSALRSGMFVTARIVLAGGRQAVFVPRAAVFSDQNTNSSRVFVIQNNKAQLRVVQLGDAENDMVEIASGVKGDELIAISNLQQLYEGANVQPQQQAQK